MQHRPLASQVVYRIIALEPAGSCIVFTTPHYLSLFWVKRTQSTPPSHQLFSYKLYLWFAESFYAALRTLLFLRFFLSLIPFLPSHCRCRGLLLHLTTVSDKHSVGLLWMGDRLAIETSTGQNRIFIRDKEPSSRRNSNPQSLQANGRRPMP